MIDPSEAILRLLDQRGAGKTICPSEAARLYTGPDGDWRAMMEEVHEAVDDLMRSGEITLSWKGEELDQRRGPYRIARR
jgi:hypothetical protein